MKDLEILGHEHLKKHLVSSAERGRIPHAQLFVGPEGCGALPMAIGYANLILNKNTPDLKFMGDILHPDLHFVFPTTTSEKVKSHPTSKLFMEEWREFIKDNPYGNLMDWLKQAGLEKKQGVINVEDAADVYKTTSLKSYTGGYKVIIIWMAEKMNISTANKLLKIIEEPPAQTVFLLVAEAEEDIIQTIRSRCQLIRFNTLPEHTIATALMEHEGIDKDEATKIAHQCQGNYSTALHYAKQDSSDQEFEELFIKWMRTAYSAKGRPSSVLELINWSEEISVKGRETQKKFLEYCLSMLRQALLINYTAHDLVFMKTTTPGFDLNKLAPFVDGHNIIDFVEEISKAIYHIERNGNQKVIFTDLSLKLTRIFHLPK